MEDASANISEDGTAMQLRTAGALSRARYASEAIVTVLTRAKAALLSRARSRHCTRVDKLLTECSEEADANAYLLAAVALMRERDVRQLPALFVRDQCVTWTRCRLLSCCVAMASALC
jgi:hypothetical protein